MKLTTKLTTLTLGLALPLSFVSCKDAAKEAGEAKKNLEEAKADATEKVQDAKADLEKTKADAVEQIKEAKAEVIEKVAAAIPTDANGIVGMFDKMNTALDGVTDLESAKKAMPVLENAGTLVKKGIEAIGGDEKLEAAIEAAPEVKAKFGEAMGKLMGHMQRIKTVSPEAYDFIDKKMDAIMQ